MISYSSKIFDGLRGQRLAPELQVAEVIFNAATDGTKQLRYIATEDIKPLLRARRESSEGDCLHRFHALKFLV